MISTSVGPIVKRLNPSISIKSLGPNSQNFLCRHILLTVKLFLMAIGGKVVFDNVNNGTFDNVVFFDGIKFWLMLGQC